MDKSEAMKLLADMRANNRMLDGCKLHDFSEDMTPDKPMSKTWKCRNCGGTISSIGKYWYEKGIEHGRR